MRGLFEPDNARAVVGSDGDAIPLDLRHAEQALAEALFLALMAPGESEAQAASKLVEELAAGLDAAAVELAKAAALERFEHEAERG